MFQYGKCGQLINPSRISRDDETFFSDRFDLDQDRLVIYDIDNEDSGEWRCVAENEIGYTEGRADMKFVAK